MDKSILNEIMTENIPKLKKETYLGTRSTQSPKQDEPKLITPIYTIIKMAKLKIDQFFLGTSILFSIVTVQIYLPTNRVRGFPFLYVLFRIYLDFLMMAIQNDMR